jgi:hypothetical protein
MSVRPSPTPPFLFFVISDCDVCTCNRGSADPAVRTTRLRRSRCQRGVPHAGALHHACAMLKRTRLRRDIQRSVFNSRRSMVRSRCARAFTRTCPFASLAPQPKPLTTDARHYLSSFLARQVRRAISALHPRIRAHAIAHTRTPSARSGRPALLEGRRAEALAARARGRTDWHFGVVAAKAVAVKASLLRTVRISKFTERMRRINSCSTSTRYRANHRSNLISCPTSEARQQKC